MASGVVPGLLPELWIHMIWEKHLRDQGFCYRTLIVLRRTCRFFYVELPAVRWPYDGIVKETKAMARDGVVEALRWTIRTDMGLEMRILFDLRHIVRRAVAWDDRAVVGALCQSMPSLFFAANPWPNYPIACDMVYYMAGRRWDTASELISYVSRVQTTLIRGQVSTPHLFPLHLISRLILACQVHLLDMLLPIFSNDKTGSPALDCIASIPVDFEDPATGRILFSTKSPSFTLVSSTVELAHNLDYPSDARMTIVNMIFGVMEDYVTERRRSGRLFSVGEQRRYQTSKDSLFMCKQFLMPTEERLARLQEQQRRQQEQASGVIQMLIGDSV